jgi:hydrogenase maturation factor
VTDADSTCITCGDVALIGEVVGCRGANAIVERDGLREEVAIELVGEVSVGERLLCHAGVALARIDQGAP